MSGNTRGNIDVGRRALIGGQSLFFPDQRSKFEALAANWDEYHIGRSQMTFNHPAYHQIIGMGSDAVPFLLERLRQGDADWVYAITCITGVEAGMQNKAGDPDKVIEAWLNWARSTEDEVGRAAIG